jgi:hypothetical protein
MYEELNVCFRLRVRLPDNYTLSVTAYDNYRSDNSPYHFHIDVRANISWNDGTGKRRSRTVFRRGDTWCGVPMGHCTDSEYAKKLVLELLAMKPGDTDADYFTDYTEDQLWFADKFGEQLSYEAIVRYGEG